MSKRILIADDDEDVRQSHRFALEAASEILQTPCLIVEVENSVDALAKIRSEHFDLILIDNDFKDKALPGHLPGIALLQLARKEGANQQTPIVFCSAETYEGLAPMVERFKGVTFPKTEFDIERASRLFADLLMPSASPRP